MTGDGKELMNSFGPVEVSTIIPVNTIDSSVHTIHGMNLRISIWRHVFFAISRVMFVVVHLLIETCTVLVL